MLRFTYLLLEFICLFVYMIITFHELEVIIIRNTLKDSDYRSTCGHK